jgi:hypothetical protein
VAFTVRSTLVDVPVATTPPPIVEVGQAPPVPVGSIDVIRSSLADDPVLTTRSPVVVVGVTPTPAAPNPFVGRSSLIYLATPRPVVVAASATPTPVAQIILSRSSFADAVAATVATPGPIVIVGPTQPPIQVAQAIISLAPGMADAPVLSGPITFPIVVEAPSQYPAGRVGVSRSTLADPPVLTTAPPIVQVGATPKPLGGAAFTSRSSLVDVVVTIGPTTIPVVEVGQAPQPVGVVNLLRSMLVDPPQLTTPQPLIVLPPLSQPRPGPAIISRSSLADVVAVGATTPGPIVVIGATPTPTPMAPYFSRSSFADGLPGTAPIVVAAEAKRAAAAPPIILRGSRADDPVLTTRAPIVVAAPIRRLPGQHGVRLIVVPNGTDFFVVTAVPPITLSGGSASTVAARGGTGATTTAAGVTGSTVATRGGTGPPTTITGGTAPTDTVR